MSEPTFGAMKIARRRIRDLEALGRIKFGTESWKIISGMIGEIELSWQKQVDELLNAPPKAESEPKVSSIDPLDCKHKHKSIVSGTEGGEQEHQIRICLDCGEITVHGRTSDPRGLFKVDILLWVREHAEAAAKPSSLIEQP